MLSKIIALDIGSKKIIATIARRYRHKYVQISAVEETAVEGIRNGVIENKRAVSHTIQYIFKKLHVEQPDITHDVYITTSNRFMQMHRKVHSCLVENRKILYDHINTLQEEAMHTILHKKTSIIQAIADEYVVDNQKIIHTPLGLDGESVKAVFSLISTTKSIADTIRKCFAKTEFTLQQIYTRPCVCTPVLLTNQEKNNGIALLDFSDETCALVVYDEGILQHLSVLPFGGSHIIRDIQTVCGINYKEATFLLKELSVRSTKNGVIILPKKKKRNTKEVSVFTLEHIVRSRLDEIVEGIRYQLDTNHLTHSIKNGLVLTGRYAKILYLSEILSEQLQLYIIRKRPLMNFIRDTDYNLQHPKYDAMIGTLYHAFDIGKNPIENGFDVTKGIRKMFGSLFEKK